MATKIQKFEYQSKSNTENLSPLPTITVVDGDGTIVQASTNMTNRYGGKSKAEI